MMLEFGLPFFFVLLYSTSTTSTKPYIPTDRLFLNCGSSTASNSKSDQRYWDADEHSKFVPSDFITTSFASTPDLLHSSLDHVPYKTARIFNTSPFTYTFSLSQGPKFLRLHFYPATYSNLNANQSFLSVSSNGYSLLTNFSAFQALGTNARVLKEFLIYVKDAKTLKVTFTPSPNSHAFINGIEIVSLPDDLYYKSKSLNYFRLVNKPVIDDQTALENIYRLNMGGGQISVQDDTGMYRSWDQDDCYICGAGSGLTPQYENRIMYTMATPNYTAPEEVYQTQRSMGKLSDKYNLTWILPVDSGFYYMLRLHFCNIIPQYTKRYQVIFKIFINNQNAEDEVDLFSLTQGSGYPVFLDYIVFVNDPDGSRSKQDLWLAMHPNPYSQLYRDAYLNGLEVFKLSTDKNLASPNPELSSTTTQTRCTTKGNIVPPYPKGRSANDVITEGISGALVLFSILVFIVVNVWQQRRFKNDRSAKDRSSDSCRHFSLKELKAATDEFSDNFVIGNTGLGKVYKGNMDNATTIVAVKRLDSSSRQGFQEFLTEIEMLSKLRHAQLVSLIGYCDDEGEMILVYDYMAHGTLREHLYNTDKPHMPWKTRMEICIGVAKGLHYLHSGGKSSIIHGDVKSTNILLDENWVAKLSDFGLSKLGSKDQSEAHVNTVVKGRLGYIDPQYCWTRKLTKKSDVYSFGVVLLELLCARPVIVQGLKDEEVSLVEWGKICYQKGTFQDIIDPNLSGEITPECLRKFGYVASICLHDEGSERPAMEEVVWRLEYALQLQEDAEQMDSPETIAKSHELSIIV